MKELGGGTPSSCPHELVVKNCQPLCALQALTGQMMKHGELSVCTDEMSIVEVEVKGEFCARDTGTQ